MRTRSSRLTGHVHARILVPVVPVYATPGVPLRKATYVPNHHEPRPPVWQALIMLVAIAVAVGTLVYLFIGVLDEPINPAYRGGNGPVNVHTMPVPGPSGGAAGG